MHYDLHVPEVKVILWLVIIFMYSCTPFQAGSSAIKLLEREVAILKRVSHPNIIQLLEVIETAKVKQVNHYRNEFHFCEFYRCVNSGESLTN